MEHSSAFRWTRFVAAGVAAAVLVALSAPFADARPSGPERSSGTEAPPTATATATDESGAACVAALSCSLEVIDRWDVPTRADWFSELRGRIDVEVVPGAGAVFENIQDVLRLSLQKGFDDHVWFLTVDAAIIEAIQAGFALAIGAGSDSPNWGASGWQRFFEEFANGAPDELNRLWGTAEQAATNYGIERARAEGHQLGETGRDARIRFALIEVGNTYRQNLARTTTPSLRAFWRVCNSPAGLLEFLTGLVLRLTTTICPHVRGFFSVFGPSVIVSLGGVAYDNAQWLKPVAEVMGLFDYTPDGLWDPAVATA